MSIGFKAKAEIPRCTSGSGGAVAAAVVVVLEVVEVVEVVVAD